MNNFSAYKETVIERIGTIPSHWNVIRIKYLTKVRKETSINGEEELLSVSESRGIVKRRELKSDDENLSRSEDLSGYKIVYKGDLVNNIMLVWKRGLGVSKFDGIVSPAYSVFSFKNNCVPEYFNYLFRTDEYITEFTRNSTGIIMSRLRLYDDSFGNIFSLLPPFREQQLISKYLYKKTQQIDYLIGKIEKKIELIKEQKSSLINKYVTKGLNKNVEMRESGIDWLGEIPKHWEITKLKYLSNINVQYGLNIESNLYCESGVRFLRITDIENDGSLKKFNGIYLNRSNVPDEYILKKGDILFSRTGGTVGKSTLIISNSEVMSFAGYLVRFSFENFDLSTFVSYFSQSSSFWYWINLQMTQSTIQNVNGEKYSNLYLPLPPNDEIKIINNFLKNKLGIFDEIIQKEFSRKEYLIEYRASLISSVVTGKICITEDMI